MVEIKWKEIDKDKNEIEKTKTFKDLDEYHKFRDTELVQKGIANIEVKNTF